MNNLINLIISLTLIIFYLSGYRFDGLELKDDNLEVYRIISFGKEIFVILEKKIIKFDMPRIFNNKDPNTREVGRYYFEIKKPQVIESEEFTPLDQSIIGYTKKYNSSSKGLENVFENYAKDSNDVFAYELEFEGVPGRRLANNRHNANDTRPFKFSLEYQYNERMTITLKYSSDKLTITSFSGGEQIDSRINSLKYPIKFATITYDRNASNLLHLLEYDEENFIRFSRFSPYDGHLSDEWQITKRMPIEAFLNKHQKFVSFSQVKGIFYDNEKKAFFIFINRFALEIEENLIETGFKLNDTHYVGAKDFKFYDPLYTPEPDIKWAKNIGKQLILRLWVANQALAINYTDEQYLHLKEADIGLPDCESLTFKFNDSLYCFKSLLYHKVGDDEKFEIKTLFESGKLPIGSNNYDQLEFIFDYENTSIWMTTRNVFQIDYELIEETNSGLIFKNELNQIRVSPNYLFESVKIETPSTSISSMIVAVFAYFLIVLLVILIMIATGYLFYKIQKRREMMATQSFISVSKSNAGKSSANKANPSTRFKSPLQNRQARK